MPLGILGQLIQDFVRVCATLPGGAIGNRRANPFRRDPAAQTPEQFPVTSLGRSFTALDRPLLVERRGLVLVGCLPSLFLAFGGFPFPGLLAQDRSGLFQHGW